MRLVFCALQMCCNVRWAVNDLAWNVRLLEGERSSVLGLRATIYYFLMWESVPAIAINPGSGNGT